MSIQIVNTDSWIEENKDSFAPPVCNKLMHNHQLIVMFVGGPNVREDYHIEEGEELFYQIKGQMCVKILENGQHKDIVIKEGEFFILPARIPHSPQRTAGSIGLVIERRRLSTETDGVRWFVPGTVNTLYEKWFHCKDLGVELVPLIKNYFASEEYKTKVPGNNVMDKIPFDLNNELIKSDKHGPYDLKEKISNNSSSAVLNLTPSELNLQFEISAIGAGEYLFDNVENIDTWFWQLEGNSSIKIEKPSSTDSDYFCFGKKDSLLVPVNYSERIHLKVAENSFVLKVTQNPNLIRNEPQTFFF